MAQDPLHVLWVEPRFPGRLGAVADWLVRRRGYRCHFYCHSAAPRDRWPASAGRGLDVVSFNVGGVAREPSVKWQQVVERGLCYSYGCWEVLEMKRPRPIDLIVGRSDGLGSTLFAPVHFPRLPVVNLFDYFHHAHRNDLAEEAGPEMPPHYFHWRRSANAVELLDLENGVVPWTPTRWQRDLFPVEYRDDFQVLHDGVDTRLFAPCERRKRVVAGRTIPEGTRVVSFAARSLDRLRGFDRFLTLANALLRERSDVICLVLGDPIVAHNVDVSFYQRDYKAHLLAENPPPDPERLWFLGPATRAVVAQVFAASDLHVYPSRPYPFARSALEALASGCVVLASDDEPAREFITPGSNGLLARADDPDDWLDQARKALDDLDGHRTLGEKAVEVVREHYAQDVTLPRLATLFDRLVEQGGG